MKILDGGTQQMSNADVLAWINSKRTQYAAEDAEDRRLDRTPMPRPRNFMTSLQKHERELRSTAKYPYTRNCTAYAEGLHHQALCDLDRKVCERVLLPLGEKYKERKPGEEGQEKALGKEQDAKSLTEPELLMLLNHAPQCVEMLQPMLENCEERYTDDEQSKIVEAVMEVLRVDEVAAGGLTREGGAR